MGIALCGNFIFLLVYGGYVSWVGCCWCYSAPGICCAGCAFESVLTEDCDCAGLCYYETWLPRSLYCVGAVGRGWFGRLHCWWRWSCESLFLDSVRCCSGF